MVEKVYKRAEVPEELKWDLTSIYESEADFEKVLKNIPKEVQQFVNTYDGKLNSEQTVFEAIRTYEKIAATLSHLNQYAYLPVAVDITDSEAQNRSRSVKNILANLKAQLSFFHTQLQELDDQTLTNIEETIPSYKALVRKIKTAKAHKLSPAVEKALAQLSPVLNAPLDLFEQIRSADMDFGSFKVEGTDYPLSFVLYEEVYMYHNDPIIRRAAYDQFNSVLKKYEHTMATVYYTQTQREKTEASMRGYDSVIEYLLSDQEVDTDLYHRQIDMIMEKFGPVMQKYITHLKEQNGLEKITYADLKSDLDPDFAQSISIEESKDFVKQALEPMGKEYVDMILQAYPERWIDFAQNKGKRSGAFCNTSYQKHPYVMLTWAGKLTDMYTLLHELGHAGHGILRNDHNPLTGAGSSLYLIEGPSTFHELLLTDYLLSETSEPRRERYILSQMITKTYFHNFVTHLIEAAFQRDVYRLIDEGKSFGADKLNELKMNVLKQFWGETVEFEEGAKRTWMRQQHYYKGLYSYTYSAGLTIATQAFLKIQKGEAAIDGWFDFLKMGGQETPPEATKAAGVDITTDRPLSDTIKYLDETIDRIIELTGELEK